MFSRIKILFNDGFLSLLKNIDRKKLDMSIHEIIKPSMSDSSLIMMKPSNIRK